MEHWFVCILGACSHGASICIIDNQTRRVKVIFHYYKSYLCQTIKHSSLAIAFIFLKSDDRLRVRYG